MPIPERFSRVIDFFKTRPNTTLSTGVLAVVAGGLIALWVLGSGTAPDVILHESGERRPYQPLPPSGETIEASYLCPGGERFTTSYDLGSNELTVTLPDGTMHTLPQIPNAAEAHFEAFDGSVAFYERDSRAHVALNGEMRHGNCIPEVTDEI